MSKLFDFNKTIIMCIVLIIFLLLASEIVLAAASDDLIFSIEPDESNLNEVNNSQKLKFTVNVENNSSEEKEVMIKSNQNSWKKTINIPANGSDSAVMSYYVEDDISGGAEIQFNFDVTCDGNSVSCEGRDSFTYYVKENDYVQMEVRLRKGQIIALGKPITFDITLSNNGNTEIKDIVVKHTLDDKKINISSLMPGEERTNSIEYLVPENISLNKEISDTFTFTSQNYSTINSDVSFIVEGVQSVSTSLYMSPSVYYVNDNIKLIFEIKNTGDSPYENLSVTNNHNTDWSYKVDYLSVKSSTNVNYNFFVSEEVKSVTFYLKDSNRNLVSEKTLPINALLRNMEDLTVTDSLKDDSSNVLETIEISSIWSDNFPITPIDNKETELVSEITTEIEENKDKISEIVTESESKTQNSNNALNPKEVRLPKTGQILFEPIITLSIIIFISVFIFLILKRINTN